MTPAGRSLPSGTVTFLFTDIEGSTKLLHELGTDRYAEALAEHRRIVREALTQHGGAEIGTEGDSFFVTFPDARGALAAAQQAQEGLSAGRIRVRMGLHTGEPTLTPEGYVGIDVHAGARVAASAHGGQVVCTRRTRDLVGDAFEFIDLGEHRLKDLGEPVWIYQLGHESFPPLKTLSNTNLPTPASSFLGREAELEEAGALLERSRLVTIVGPGGSGKTRFSIELASRHLDRFPNGVFWVPLATVTDPALVIETAALVLGSKDGLAEHIGERHMMLLFDNLEQVIDVSPRLAEIAEACPNVTIMVTSRELMRVRGERPYALPPLDADEGVALFVERAGVVVTDTVIELCRRLEGLPLAIELAAARASVLTPEQLVARLGERLDLLRGGRDADPRQQTLRATIEWSHDLLNEAERTLFAKLSVFAGGCTLETAGAIAQADLDTLQSLVEKSLVRRTGERFWMLETIREFADERLNASPDGDDIHLSHAEHMLLLAASANLSGESDGPQRHDIAIAEQDNARAAIEWALTAKRSELAFGIAISLENFWVTHNPFEELRLFERLLAHASEVAPVVRARALRAVAGATMMAGDYQRSITLYEESLARFRAVKDERGAGIVLQRIGANALNLGDTRRARSALEEGLEILRRVGSRRGETQAIGSLGDLERLEGNTDKAFRLLEQSAAMAAEIGRPWWEVAMQSSLAELALDGGRPDEARARAERVTELAHTIGDRRGIVYGLAYLARAAALAGDEFRAGMLWGAIEAEEARGQIGVWEREREAYERRLLEVAGSRFQDGRREGRRSSLDRAVERALSGD